LISPNLFISNYLINGNRSRVQGSKVQSRGLTSNPPAKLRYEPTGEELAPDAFHHAMISGERGGRREKGTSAIKKGGGFDKITALF
jgi:hypothetical protein